jgi:hypothetical protein
MGVQFRFFDDSITGRPRLIFRIDPERVARNRQSGVVLNDQSPALLPRRQLAQANGLGVYHCRATLKPLYVIRDCLKEHSRISKEAARDEALGWDGVSSWTRATRDALELYYNNAWQEAPAAAVYTVTALYFASDAKGASKDGRSPAVCAFVDVTSGTVPRAPWLSRFQDTRDIFYQEFEALLAVVYHQPDRDSDAPLQVLHVAVDNLGLVQCISRMYCSTDLGCLLVELYHKLCQRKRLDVRCRFISGEKNPSDAPTRGDPLDPEKFAYCLTWLQQDEDAQRAAWRPTAAEPSQRFEAPFDEEVYVAGDHYFSPSQV